MSGLHEIELRRPSDTLCARYRELGLWHDNSLGAFVDERLRLHASQEAWLWSQVAPARSNFGDLREAARRFAGGLQARGIRSGDAVSYQLPNSLETLVVLFGAAMAGATLVPIVHFYGSREVSFILEQSASRLHVSAAELHGCDAAEFERQVRARFPDAPDFVVIGGAGPGQIEYDALAATAPLAALPHVAPDQPAVVGYTSGTTAAPKGVIHTGYSVLAELHQLVRHEAGDYRPLLTGAPLAHAIGMLGGTLLPLTKGKAIHIIDRWDPGQVLAAMLEADLNAGSGSTYFLKSLLEHPGFGPEHAAHMQRIGLGGAPVPAAVTDLAESLGILVVRSYGSTEHMSITMSDHRDPPDRRKYTDGRALTGCDISLRDSEGRPVPTGEPGEIWSRGPDLFWGYTDPELTPGVFDADGWFYTEDVGVLDADGFLTITDRIKDIIIRGGENVSASEIEEQLMRLDGVLEVAVVAAPDERLGERGCAIFRMAPGRDAPALDELQRHLAGAGLAKQKWPEEIAAVSDFPRTPTGKIKKAVLRRELADRGH